MNYVTTSAVLTVSTDPLDDGDLMGQAVEFTDVCATNKYAHITNLLLLDTDSQGAEIDVYIFRSDPGSLGTVNEPMSLTAAQIDLLIGAVHIQATDYFRTSDKQLACVHPSPILVPSDGTSVWIACEARFPATYASGEIEIKLCAQREDDQ